ncbi:hypothetical protein DS830_04370 [Bombilactobacillus bombi]|uniref:CdaR family protein n=1 Tax=Bombilactobacillus bombi TaxID=1303590 RepID=UPI000E576DB6|nr:CdaR family protein [Bombilactobacillus bombi]AXX64750.1 hypothetical protein DS830_04370 [Bombilactobacillus bombi]
MNKWRHFTNSKYFYMILSLAVAIWIYISVSAPGLGSTRSAANSNNVAVAEKSATITMNLQVNVDTNSFFVTGYPKQVEVKIQGPAALVTATKNTQNFTTYIDLRQLGVGKHRVRIRQNGLNRELKYTIKPHYVDIDIEPRMEKVFPIQTAYNSGGVAQGYEVGDVSVNPQIVQVVGARSEVQRVSQIVARANLPKNSTTDFHQEVLLQALDAQGHTLSVLMSPQTTNVKIPISLPKKKVPLRFTQTGASDKEYNLSSEVNEVTIFARKSVLDKTNEIVVPIDVTKLGKKNYEIITLNQIKSDIIDSNPRTIKVYARRGNSDNQVNSNVGEIGGSN